MTRSGRSVGRNRSSLFGNRDQPIHDTIGSREADRNESESRSNERNQRLSFQAYLDTIEEETGLTPRQLLELAQQKGFSHSSVKAGTMYYLFFPYNYGGLNDIVVAFGGDRVAWLSDSGAAVLIIVLVNSAQFVGISMVIYLAGLQSIPTEYYEASRIDGANAW